MAQEGVKLHSASDGFQLRVREIERQLRASLEALDELGLSHAGAHVDLALHQLRRDAGEPRSSAPEAGSCEPGTTG